MSFVQEAIGNAEDFPVSVHALGTLRIHVRGKHVVFGRKLPRKPLALLKCLVAQGGDGVPRARLIHSLWPGEDFSNGYPAFWLALHRLRALLGDPTAVELSGGCVTLRRDRVWVDAFAFAKALDAPANRPDAVESALTLYRGALFDGDEEPVCVLLARERLRRRLVAAIEMRGRHLEHEGRRDEARRLYQRGLDLDGISETLYLGVIRCQLDNGQLADAFSTYHRLCHLMARTLGRGPSPAVRALMARADHLSAP